jgi:hypothetical protein
MTAVRYVDERGVTRVLTRDDLLIREDGRVEWLCRHGIGHPIGHKRGWKDWMGVHGCDGCCVGEPWQEEGR